MEGAFRANGAIVAAAAAAASYLIGKFRQSAAAAVAAAVSSTIPPILALRPYTGAQRWVRAMFYFFDGGRD